MVSRLISVVDVDIAPKNPYESCVYVVSRLISVVDVDMLILPLRIHKRVVSMWFLD